MGEDALENTEGEGRKVVNCDVLDQVLLGAPAHVHKHHEHSGETSIEQQLEGAHLWVPCAEEFASDQVICREHGVHDEVEDGKFRVVGLGRLFIDNLTIFVFLRVFCRFQRF